jgi:hypothetical protein
LGAWGKSKERSRNQGGIDKIIEDKIMGAAEKRGISRERTHRSQSSGAATKAEEGQKSEIRNPKSETNPNFVNF